MDVDAATSTTLLPQPDAAELEMATVLHALGDPVRLRVVRALAADGEQHCNAVELPVTKSTRTYHFWVLRNAGVITTRRRGAMRLSRLRSEDLEHRFPGLLDAVLTEP